ncbi:MAG: AAA family ATPase, partial [Parvibaculales bacterium]
MQFKQLKIIGFKSFIEPLSIDIEEGLTGIVGPNGCGKSNLLEALRWVMGETSYKTMRGEGMEDVIFSGTKARPARNMAEVTLIIDNRARDALAGYNDSDEIEINRRIERETGSSYKINGHEVRQKDVQLFFAHAASGAKSSGLVSQGRIAAIINASPEERRKLIEEAAGITALRAQRHDSELRHKATLGNLEKVDADLGEKASQMRGLKRQARLASRYRKLTENIRNMEAELLYMSWLHARQQQEKSTSALGVLQ